MSYNCLFLYPFLKRPVDKETMAMYSSEKYSKSSSNNSLESQHLIKFCLLSGSLISEKDSDTMSCQGKRRLLIVATPNGTALSRVLMKILKNFANLDFDARKLMKKSYFCHFFTQVTRCTYFYLSFDVDFEGFTRSRKTFL